MSIELAGNWLSTYTYHGGQEFGRHVLLLAQDGLRIVGISPPQDDGSVLSMALKHDPAKNTLTGTWQEATSPTGEFKGGIFDGALQLILNSDGTLATGKWVGHNSKISGVNSGAWMLHKQ